jgi:hypothetical protein
MENVVKTRLQSVQFGEPQTYKNIPILPLITPADSNFQYRTLGEALATWDIAITEVSAAGSVPDLLVVNRANTPVLLIDGEELAGAKQNRVLIVDQGRAVSPLSAAPAQSSVISHQSWPIPSSSKSPLPKNANSPPPATAPISVIVRPLLPRPFQHLSFQHFSIFPPAAPPLAPRPSPPAPPAPSQPISAFQLSAFQHFPFCGSALVQANELIHAAFFRLDAK